MLSNQEGYFDFWRPNRGPTQFFQISIPATFDKLLLAFTFAVIVISVAFLFILPGFRGISRLYYFVRVSISIFLLWVIMTGASGQYWEVGGIETRTPYKVFSRRIINASLGVRIGLQSVNVTLRTNPFLQEIGPDVIELIDFNERFEWKWRQGREGYGPFSGQIQQDYREKQNQGTPIAILSIAEYFTIDEELIRWGRSFRTAGWFTWIVVWSAFPLWAAANLLSLVVSFYAGLLFIGTGVLMLVGNIIWASIRWGTQPLEIPFQDGTIRFHYGVSFYLVMAGGILSVVYGALIVVADLWFPQAIADFFDLDVTKDGEHFHHDDKESEKEESDGDSDVEGRRNSRRHPHRKTLLQRLRPTRRRRKRPNTLLQETLQEHVNETFEEEDEEVFYNVSPGGTKKLMTKSSVSEASTSENRSSLRSYEENDVKVTFALGEESESSGDEVYFVTPV